MTALRRAFTLLEVMLAAVLGTLIVISAIGLFGIIQRTDIRQAERMALTEEIARTHRTIERALTSLVMSNAPLPGSEEEMDLRLREYERAVDNQEPEPYNESDPPPRFVLRPDPEGEQMDFEVEGRAGRMNVQRLELTARIPPVIGARPEDRMFDPFADARRRAMTPEERRREAQRLEREDRDRREQEREDRQRERTRRDSDVDRDDARGESAADANLDEEDEEQEASVAIAPGVRGVFELIPDNLAPLGGATIETIARKREGVGDGLTLWWRELPPVLDPDATDEEIDRLERRLLDWEGRRVPLLAGLKWLRWEIYRGDRFDTRTLATWQRELPAYVKVSFETVAGRRENWMFEVAWTNGHEPGTEVNMITGSLQPRSGSTRPPTRSSTTRPLDGSGGSGTPIGGSGGGPK